MKSERFHCRVCGTVDEHRTYEVREMMFGTREIFSYFQCNNCQCLQIATIPENLGRFYPNDYYSLNSRPEPETVNIAHRWLQKQLTRTALFDRGYKISAIIKNLIDLPREIHDPCSGLSIGNVLRKAGIKSFSAQMLDIGCGSYSPWLTNLSRLGFRNLTGADPFVDADHHYENVHIYRRSVDEIGGKYDLITLHHSLEHMPDQLHTMQKIKTLLKPEGICLVRIPLVSSYAWEKYGVNWVELDAPRHLYLHSLASLKFIGERVGLNLIDIAYDSLPFEFYGSEQYMRDIPLNSPRSLWANPDSDLFTTQEKEAFTELAEKVNRDRNGGRAGFYFAHSFDDYATDSQSK